MREGAWSTPAHEHGRSEEIFYVLAGQGLSWQRGEVAEIGAGDCIVYLAGSGAHTLHALTELDVLAFGPRERDESPRFPRLGGSLLGNRFVDSSPGAMDGLPTQFVREAELGPPELPAEPGPRPTTIVNVADVEGGRPSGSTSGGRGGTSALRPARSRPGSSTSRSSPARSPRRSTATRSRMSCS